MSINALKHHPVQASSNVKSCISNQKLHLVSMSNSVPLHLRISCRKERNEIEDVNMVIGIYTISKTQLHHHHCIQCSVDGRETAKQIRTELYIPKILKATSKFPQTQKR